MWRFGDRFLALMASVWLVATGTFLFVKGLDISLVACRASTCGDVGELLPGITSFVFGVGMLLAWPFLFASPDGRWSGRLGVGLVCGALAAGATAGPVLAVTERLGVPLWICAALISAVTIRPPAIARSYAIQGRVIVGVMLGAAVVATELLLDGDAYLFAFTTCVALTPPAFAGVDDFAAGWRPGGSAPADLGPAGEVDDAQDQENDQQDPYDVVHAASFVS